MNCKKKNYWKTHSNNTAARESNNFNRKWKIIWWKNKNKSCEDGKKSIKIIFELINVYEMMIKTEGEEINVMYKKNER